MFKGEKFPRGQGKMISILIPTRKRPQMLRSSITNLYQRAGKKDQIEFVVKIDEDDIESVDICKQIGLDLPISLKVLIGPRGMGYKEMHIWYNEMAKAADGDWLLVFNDDATMLTENWDGWISAPAWSGDITMPVGTIDGIWLCILNVSNRPGSREFFAVRREVVEVLGHTAMNCHVDTYLMTVMSIIERISIAQVDVEHLKDDIKDETAESRRQACVETMQEIIEPQAIQCRIDDAAKLLEYIVKFRIDFLKSKKEAEQESLTPGPNDFVIAL